ncbi:carbon-monoxide dehydrogenase medium subunit/2-furoyl-CoA dehydrogenase FAD binding subunit [Evansella vedderi]|uniref:Carbon-monoxide dehydrogenase medium subunit/2-furoyl-CoA dehydrogenase FAD binding subunit n=1 Tax=Evansella vedderi TaxID=38282 RepID=A0ABT9ZQ65_9BACI|nr:xanthine dehydrogenase family protein subunit M [Evansella vedderi]MDQ0253381.1 carbon-monoxide dehydrogenase medium subunit/2-furoyl-CoA dehydrogenase FAD binding subunit [Evansella vedderi]
MKPATFDYYRPDSVVEALQLLEEYGDEGKLLAGGQSFIPILNMRMSEPESLIDINHLKELDYIKEEDGYLKIGAVTRQSKLEKSPLVKKLVPILVEATSFIGHIQTRNRGTVGGSVVHADPSAELPLTLLTLDAKVTIKSMDEEREANLRDFFITYLTTEIMPSELLTEIQIPLQHMSNGYAFEEFSRRHGDFALVAVACLLDVDEVGTVTSGRLAVGGIDAVPVLAEDAMDLLIGKKLSESLLQTVGEKVVEDAEPDDDLHASKEYRLNLAKVLIKRAIQKAYGRAVKRGDSL